MSVSFRIALPLLFCLVGGASAASTTIEERMSEAEFRQAGLSKLSPSELEALNQWLATHSNALVSGNRTPAAAGGPVSTAPPDDRTGFRAQDAGRDVIVSRIAGTFSGWGPKSILKLENGQRWQITDGSSFDFNPMEHPQIRIEPKSLGSWMFHVEGYNTGARVTRVE